MFFCQNIARLRELSLAATFTDKMASCVLPIMLYNNVAECWNVFVWLVKIFGLYCLTRQSNDSFILMYFTYCRWQEMCSALNFSTQKKMDASLQNGVRWLLRQISRMWAELDDRVKTDVENKARKESREKAERAKRIQHSRELRSTVYLIYITSDGLKWDGMCRYTGTSLVGLKSYQIY